ncbi:putative glycolate, D-lactate, or L-lactate dehydrogenase, FAD-linked subunit [Burkholderiales bacterium]|nr:putative glycolate, D-lactate, or L-lactate dehydrogenase, FAD-linked subunit [Burkholderiales bacterium]
MILPATFTAELAQRFGERFATGAAVRDHHGRDESAFAPMPPDAVVFVESTEEVAALVRACAAHRVPLIAFGAGSSLEGQVLAARGGVCVDLSRMQRILAIHDKDLTASVEAGVTRLQLNAELKDKGLFFAVDPGANATLGGMVATRASGTNALRYGTMRENVLALTVVGAQGQVLRTARRAKKSAAGYDLTRLFIGSEGTLGIVTEVTVKLATQPEAIAAAICNFPSVDAAVRTTIAAIQVGVALARCELLDAAGVRAVNSYSKLALRETPLLLFEFHGSESALAEHAAAVQEIAHEHGGVDFVWARAPEERSRLWAARHNAYFAGLQLRPGCRSITTDVCVPISRLAECIEATREDLARASFPSMLIGHVGDGNFHVQMLIDPNAPAERDEAEVCNERLVHRALAMDGTCSGEHGVGLHKIDFLVAEHGPEAIEMMARIKQALDPLGILNPGKMLR